MDKVAKVSLLPQEVLYISNMGWKPQMYEQSRKNTRGKEDKKKV